MSRRYGVSMLALLITLLAGALVARVSGQGGPGGEARRVKRCVGLATAEDAGIYRAFEDGTVEFWHNDRRRWGRISAREEATAATRGARRCVGIAVSQSLVCRVFEDGTTECLNATHSRWVRLAGSP